MLRQQLDKHERQRYVDEQHEHHQLLPWEPVLERYNKDMVWLISGRWSLGVVVAMSNWKQDDVNDFEDLLTGKNSAESDVGSGGFYWSRLVKETLICIHLASSDISTDMFETIENSHKVAKDWIVRMVIEPLQSIINRRVSTANAMEC